MDFVKNLSTHGNCRQNFRIRLDAIRQSIRRYLLTMTALEHDYRDLYFATTSQVPDAMAIGTNGDLNTRLAVLMAASRAGGEFALDRVLAGVHPSHSFNAQAVRVESGFLLLVNIALMNFALQVAFIVGGLIPSTFRGRVLPCEITTETARILLRRKARSLITREDVGEIEFIPSEQRFPFAQFLFTTLVDFVLSHELAHVVCGHFDQEKIVNPRNLSPRLQYYVRSWEQELEADITAMKTIQAVHNKSLDSDAVYCGPVLFFELVSVIERIANGNNIEKKGLQLVSHPSAGARRSAIITNTAGFYGKHKIIDQLVATIATIR